eukprot:COSAG06_NODE_15623_length_1057_cov_2.175365_2_plen_90_part_00
MPQRAARRCIYMPAGPAGARTVKQPPAGRALTLGRPSAASAMVLLEEMRPLEIQDAAARNVPPTGRDDDGRVSPQYFEPATELCLTLPL